VELLIFNVELLILSAEFRLKTESAFIRASLLFTANIKPMGKQPQQRDAPLHGFLQ